MNKITRIFYPVLAGGIGLSLFLAVFLTFDSEIGHFSIGVPFVAYVLFVVLSLALTAAHTVLLRKAAPPTLPVVTLPRIFTAYASALLALAIFGIGVYDLVKFRLYTIPGLLELVTLPGLAAFFIYSVSGKSAEGENGKKGTATHAISGILSCLCVNAMLFKGYFDFTLPLNSPIRNSITLMEASLLLWLLSETRTILGKNTAVFASIARGTVITLAGGVGLGLLLVVLICPAQVPDGLFLPDYALALFAAAYTALTPADNPQQQ